VDLVVYNPFNSEVNLSDLTVVVAGPTDNPDWNPDLVAVEVLDEIVLDPRETRTVSIVGLFGNVHTCNRLNQRFHCQYWQNDQ
jgi:hypothetical protein